MACNYRMAQVNDIPGIVRVIESQPLWTRYGYGGNKAASDFDSAITKGDVVVVAMQADRVLGVAWFVPTGVFGRSPYLRLLAVLAGHEGGGVGSQLLAEAEAACPSRAGGWFLLVSDFNTRGQAFYRCNGYTQCGHLPGYVLPDVAELLYWKAPGPV